MNNYFSFKQFTVWQDKTAMKVGTDGVLLGVLANCSKYSTPQPFIPKKILDIGTGTGLVALILAQRFPQTEILGVDIDTDATAQASDNFKNSPWSNRLSTICHDIVTLQTNETYDLIVCNPPYFNDSLKCPNDLRSIARHTITLNYQDLVKSVKRLINSNGKFVIILPTDSFKSFMSIAEQNELYCSAYTNVFPNINKPSKRIVAEFQNKKILHEPYTYTLTIEESRHIYTFEFKELTKDYYLDRK